MKFFMKFFPFLFQSAVNDLSLPIELRSEGKNIQKSGDLHLVLDGMTVPAETLVALGAVIQNGERLNLICPDLAKGSK